MEIKINNLDQISAAAEQFLQAIGDNKIIAFYGHMGVGKTTFVKAICDALGVEDVVNSPTFAIVNEYTDQVGDAVYHFDFYRIKNLAEVVDLGFENYVDSGSLCLMEWPELIEDLLPEETLKVSIVQDDSGVRTVSF